MSFKNLVDSIVHLINVTLIPVLVLCALALFLWGGVRYIYRSGNPKGSTSDKNAMLWGLLALFALVSIAGIINVFKQIIE